MWLNEMVYHIVSNGYQAGAIDVERFEIFSEPHFIRLYNV